ncbi:CHASE domain-containing protein [Desulfobulbus rhabdoformis]|uniref:CHASE domain-containing protein n=1 Tax=Desulfobulbus rhabdoformis TaxID=34032 RepID=UPI001962961B|nr:CHASE domain-containing protein [Desulfobulbus rhabdoformis]MBM9613971.1 CHASE domain-containing protein [Desulfobulbus rhabdoformis]
MLNDKSRTVTQSNHSVFYSFLLPLLVLGITLTTTFLLWQNIDQRISKRAQMRFQTLCDDIIRQLSSRLQNNETILLGGNSLFEVRGEELTRSEWHTYASSLHLAKTNPGILGFGYSVWLDPQKVSSLEEKIRQEGFPQFRLHPKSERDAYSTIIWLEPFNKANQRAFGYDMYSEPVRRAAMEKARDTGNTTITGKVILVQEMEVIKQNGILMYIPSYRTGMPLGTLEQRRKALRGYVYSPIRMDDFAYGALKIMPQDIDFTIYTGNSPVASEELFNTWKAEGRSAHTAYQSKFEKTTVLDVYGTTWCMTFRSLPEFDTGFDQNQPQIILVAGILISFGLSLLAFMQSRARQQAVIIAAQMHEQLLTQQKFALYFQQSPLAVIEWDQNELITAWNPAAARIFGYTAEDVLGRKLSLLQTNNQEDGKNVQLNRTKTGEIIDCEWYSAPLTNRDNRAAGMVALVENITERKKLEHALKKSETQFRLLFEEHSAIMLLLDPESGNIIKANNAASEFYGYSRAQLNQMSIGQISCLPQENIDQILRQIHKGELSEFAVPHRLADGSVRTVEMHSASISFQDSSVNFAIVHDITSRIQAEEERERLETQNIQLQKAESLARMAGAIAHHFNNKLQAVTMSLEMVKELLPQYPKNQQIQDLAGSALQSAEAAAEVSKLLLIYLGSAPCQFSLLDLRVICSNYQPILKATIPESIHYSFLATDLSLMINANANNIQQVLTNLVANAWEACPNHEGEVRLRIGKVEGTEIPANSRFPVDFVPEERPYAFLEVVDTGVGIRQMDIARLFDPFFSSKFTGRGMGLSAVLGIVRAHKGVVTVLSEEGEGSVFTVYFPLIQLNIVESKKPPSPKESPLQGGTILVVDDEEIIRKIVGEMLERLGYSILEAANGAEAVEIFNENRESIDCVLCDVVMPRMNGWDTVASIREKAPDIPVILASGYNEAHVMVGHNELVIQAFLEKPFLFSKLKEVLANLL